MNGTSISPHGIERRKQGLVTEVRWDGGTAYEMIMERGCDASPEDVYEVLTDLSTHLDWAGRRQYPGFRLLSLDGNGPAKVGTEFTSVGSIPMTRRRWENHNRVVVAQPPAVLEFHTIARVARRPGKGTEGTYEHRYEIEPEGTGSRVAYHFLQTDLRNPLLRMRLPLMRTVANRVMLPFLCRRGFKNLLRLAERRGYPATAAVENAS